MPRTARDVPPPLELLCLRALWSLGEGNVNAVRQIVAESRPLAYTTIMTVLDRLVRKGMLARRKVGRSFCYAPQATRDAARRAAVRELLDGYFDGSEEALIGFLQQRDREPAPSPAPADVIDTILL
ncbi:MAG TPA: BlaI/MecI/CopY family transcriptional regulator [Bryobacteraceae bacterium]|nr:BlaI/MecI/CopY family transcriptional regulator [Bryobacteraceae bacterium]